MASQLDQIEPMAIIIAAVTLGTILLVVVLGLYWIYDRIVGIDNVSLG